MNARLVLLWVGIVTAGAAGCGSSLSDFAEGTLRIVTAEDCSRPAEVPAFLELQPAGGAIGNRCPTLDAGARIFVDDIEGDLFQRGGAQVVLCAPEGFVVPFTTCNFPEASLLLSPAEGEHEVRIVLGDDAITTTFVFPDELLSCEGVAECSIEVEELGFECG